MTTAQSQIVDEIIDIANDAGSMVSVLETSNSVVLVVTNDTHFNYCTEIYPNGEYATRQKTAYESWSDTEPYLMPLGGALCYV